MKVEIWSDVMCPFCYIGKRRFEKALEQFPQKDQIEIEWKSFQLDPEMKTQPGKRVTHYLAERKGWTLEYARGAQRHVTAMAEQEGLEYNMEKAVVANSFNAHRVAHLAKLQGKGDAMEEALFKAYFTDGKNIDDAETLIALGESIGLNRVEVADVLSSDKYAADVQRDIYEAQQVGVRGVPFFVFDSKYAVSGAQASDTFLQVLHKAYSEKQPEVIQGDVCTPDGECN